MVDKLDLYLPAAYGGDDRRPDRDRGDAIVKEAAEQERMRAANDLAGKAIRAAGPDANGAPQNIEVGDPAHTAMNILANGPVAPDKVVAKIAAQNASAVRQEGPVGKPIRQQGPVGPNTK